MSDEQILDNAVHATNTPANEAPDVREARRQEIMKSPDYWKDGPQTKSLRAEMARIIANADVVAKQDAARAEAAAKIPANETRRRQLTAELTSGKLTDAERAAKTRELQQIIASQATDAERAEMVNQPVEVLRERFGLDAKNQDVLAPIREKWNSEGEAQVLATFADHGVAPEAVRDIFAFYTDAFNGALGEAANIEDIGAMEGEFRTIAKKHGLGTKLVEALVQWQRGRLPS